jgi:hypothetical protein
LPVSHLRSSILNNNIYNGQINGNILSNLTISKSSISLWTERWFLSSNAKDIGTLYLIFALFSGLLGTAFSVLIRLELSGPGVQYIADNQLYNSIITAHAILMIFFMVEKIYILKLQPLTLFYDTVVNNNNNPTALIRQYNDNTFEKTELENNQEEVAPVAAELLPKNNKEGCVARTKKYNYVEILVDDPFNNRDIILEVTKKQKGVYIWETLDGKHIYVGHSINLYNRISSYFMPSILKTKARRVLRYLNKYGFSYIKLTIYIISINSSLDEVIELEQHFIDTLNPNLNIDLITSGSGYHSPMNEVMRDKLRKERGISVYLYNAKDLTLLYIFGSKQQVYSLINIHHNTLNDCLILGKLYLDTFFFSLDLIEESEETNLISLEEIKKLVSNKRDVYEVKHPASKVILVEFKDEPNKTLVFNSLTSLANHLKGNRQVIRSYLKGEKSGYYRGKLKFTYKI